MSFNYQPNYMALIKALQSGGLEGASQAKQARSTRGLGGRRVLNTEMVTDSEAKSVSEQMLSYFSDIDEQNKAAKAKSQAQRELIEGLGGEVDPVTGEAEPPMEDPDVNTSGDILDFIASLEGFKSNAYDDYGQLTIGFGTKAKSRDQKITKEEAMNELSKEVMEFRTIVIDAKNQYGYDWSENQIDALTSFAFNLGQGNFKKLLTGDEGGLRGDEEISEAMMLYNKAGGKVLPGLTKRRQAEVDLFTQGYNQ